MKKNPVYLSMNTDQKEYADGQFWFGGAIGVVVGVASILIGLHYMA